MRSFRRHTDRERWGIMLKAGIVGFGGIAQAHKSAYDLLEAKGLPVKLAAVCDIEPEKFKGTVRINITEGMDPSGNSLKAACYTDMDEMCGKEELDIIDICLPTFLHAGAAIKMLDKGYNVLSEKPMAINYDSCMEMLKAAARSGKQLMIGQCLRFYPMYQFLKEIIESKRYGEVISAFFERLSTPPIWGWENWFMDVTKSGGCMLDMHIHDIDMARWLFGEPKHVVCNSRKVYSMYDTVSTQLFYGDDRIVSAVGDWSLPVGCGFRHKYRVNLEKAAVIFDSSDVMVYERDGRIYKQEISDLDGITNEIEYFVDLISNNKENTINSAGSAAKTIRLIEIMKTSADRNGSKEIVRL
jgi:predicted dehydrogenase